MREVISAAGVRVVYLTSFSSGFNPIEQAFAKLRMLLRAAAARTVDDFHAAIQKTFAAFIPQKCGKYLNAFVC